MILHVLDNMLFMCTVRETNLTLQLDSSFFNIIFYRGFERHVPNPC